MSGSTAWPQGRPRHLGHVMGRWTVRTSSELTDARRELSASAAALPVPDGGREGTISVPDTLALLLSELVTNALRHASPPAEVLVSREDGVCLIDVADPDVDTPPSPEHDRSPGLGGHGLPLVAMLAQDRGWYVEEDRKHVWACLRT